MRTTIPRSALVEAMEDGPAHYRPFLLAIRDHGCAYALILPHAGPFLLPDDKPVAAIVGDDLMTAVGPAGFDDLSMARYVRTCQTAVVVSSAAHLEPYATAAATPIQSRRNSILIETRPEQEIPWVEFVTRIAPSIQLLVYSVRGGSA